MHLFASMIYDGITEHLWWIDDWYVKHLLCYLSSFYLRQQTVIKNQLIASVYNSSSLHSNWIPSSCLLVTVVYTGCFKIIVFFQTFQNIFQTLIPSVCALVSHGVSLAVCTLRRRRAAWWLISHRHISQSSEKSRHFKDTIFIEHPVDFSSVKTCR